MTDDNFMTLQDVADRLKISVWTVKDHRRRGILKASRLGRRVRVSEDQFVEYVERLEAVGAGSTPSDQAAPPRSAEVIETVRAALEAGELDEAIAAACRRGRVL